MTDTKAPPTFYKAVTRDLTDFRTGRVKYDRKAIGPLHPDDADLRTEVSA